MLRKKRERVSCGGLFGDDDATAPEGLVRRILKKGITHTSCCGALKY
jgi:hypothetical protein